MRKSMMCGALLVVMAASVLFSVGAAAKVTTLEVLSRTAYGTFKSGDYTRWDIRVVGELAPISEKVPDLEKAPRNANGMVEYATRLSLIMPVDSGRGNGALLIDVPNRGRAISLSLYNSPRNVFLPVGSLNPGTGFLQDYGYTVAIVPWELGYGIELPTFNGTEGKPRSIEGVALPVIRDVADFLAHVPAAPDGSANPLAGKIQRTIALGYSQTGRLLRSFLLGGYNSTEGRQVFAGMHILGAPSGHIVLRSTPGPTSGAGAIPTFADPEMRGVAEEPLAVSDVLEQAGRSGQSLPRMVFVNTTTDYFSLRASLGRTGGTGKEEKAIPANVRVYDVAGASHALASGPNQCKYPYATLDWHPIMRSTLIALDRWVSTNASPPANELMPIREAGADAQALKLPGHLSQGIIQVPMLDQDGNAAGGVRLPDITAPLGTHAAQNPPLSFICSLAAGYVAFTKNKAERDAAKDPRLSIAERYKDQNDYLDKIRSAARDLEQRRLLLSEDAAVIVYSAAETNVLK